jgi:hypothetical protein
MEGFAEGSWRGSPNQALRVLLSCLKLYQMVKLDSRKIVTIWYRNLRDLHGHFLCAAQRTPRASGLDAE